VKYKKGEWICFYYYDSRNPHIDFWEYPEKLKKDLKFKRHFVDKFHSKKLSDPVANIRGINYLEGEVRLATEFDFIKMNQKANKEIKDLIKNSKKWIKEAKENKKKAEKLYNEWIKEQKIPS